EEAWDVASGGSGEVGGGSESEKANTQGRHPLQRAQHGRLVRRLDEESCGPPHAERAVPSERDMLADRHGHHDASRRRENSCTVGLSSKGLPAGRPVQWLPAAIGGGLRCACCSSIPAP